MVANIQTEAERIAVEVHEMLVSVDASRARREMALKMSVTAAALSERIHLLLEEMREQRESGRLQETLARLSEKLEEVRKNAPEAGERFQQECRQIRERIQPSYAALVEALRNHAITVPNFRPTNPHRTIFHVFSGICALLMIQKVMVTDALYHWLPLFLPVVFWGLEISRRRSEKVNDFLMANLARFAHAHEWERVNSGTWYGTALALLAWTVEPFAASVAVMVLGVADPAASLVGRRYGSIKIWRGKSLEGLMAFWLVASFVGLCVLLYFGPVLSLSVAIGVAVLAGLFAALAETFMSFVDDNFTVPLISGWSISALVYCTYALGIS